MGVLLFQEIGQYLNRIFSCCLHIRAQRAQALIGWKSKNNNRQALCYSWISEQDKVKGQKLRFMLLLHISRSEGTSLRLAVLLVVSQVEITCKK